MQERETLTGKEIKMKTVQRLKRDKNKVEGTSGERSGRQKCINSVCIHLAVF